MRRQIMFFILSLMCMCAKADNSVTSSDYTIKSIRYWFDTSGVVQTSGYAGNSFTLDASALTDGVHTLYYQLITDTGDAAPAGTCTFMKVSDDDLGGVIADSYSIKSVRYWFDPSGDVQTSSYTGNGFTLDASALADGVHTLYYQLITENGIVAPTATSTFMKISDDGLGGVLADSYEIKSVRYWFDRSGDVQTSSYTGKSFTLDASSLKDGMHVLYYQLVCTDGHVSATGTSTFIKVSENDMAATDETYTPQTIHYWIDGNEAEEKSVTYTTSSIALDLSYLDEGDHTLYYQVYASDKKVSPVYIQTFTRSLYDIDIRATQTFKDGNYNDSILSAKPYMILNTNATDTAKVGHLTVETDDSISLGRFIQRLHYGSDTSTSKFTGSGDKYYHLSTLLNEGSMSSEGVCVESSFCKDRWYFISLPFNARIADVTTADNVRWVVRRFDGDERSAGRISETWKNLEYTDMMVAGQGYIIQATRNDDEQMCTFVFTATNGATKNNIFSSADQSVALNEYSAEFSHNRGWNLIANPYPSFFDSRQMTLNAPITVWNGSGYDAYSLVDDSYVMMPFEAFFVQKPLDENEVVFGKDGRQHSWEATSSGVVAKAPKSPLMLADSSARQLYNFYISDGLHEDHCRIVLNENASKTYEMEKDACKFMDMGASGPMIYTLYDGVSYAINERPKGDGIVPLTISADVDSTLTIRYVAGKNAEETVLLVDSYTGKSFNLVDSDVELAPEACADADRYYISFVDAPTAIEVIKATNPDKTEPSAIYDIQGRAVSKVSKHNVYIHNGKKFLEK